MTARERRRWVTHLAEDVPAGPDGQPAHAAGAEVVVVTAVHIPDLGGVSFAVPRPSTLLLEAAVAHLRRAARLRKALVKQTRPNRWTQPGMERSFSNEDLLQDFFRGAMAGIMCAFAALDNLANELLPWDFTYVDPDKGIAKTRQELEWETGIELRLSRVAAAATQRPNLRTENPKLWDRLMMLKSLRDDISHAKAEQAASEGSMYGSIFARIFDAALLQFPVDVTAAADHYLG